MGNWEPTGTKRTHYSAAKDGPFRCDCCEHYDEDTTTSGECNHPEVMADPQVPKDRDGHGDAEVDAAGCCEYFRARTRSRSAFAAKKA